jgi:putative ABC transport system ATP-binding protein
VVSTGTRVLLRTCTRNARRLWTGTALIGLHQVCEAAVPILIGVIVDRAVATGATARLALWIGVLAGLFLLLTTAYRNGARQLMKAIAEEAHVLRLEMSGKILHPRGVRTDMRAGHLLTVSTSDADQTSYLLDYVPRITGALVATAVSAVALCVVSVPLGLVVLIATPVVLVTLQLAAPVITRRVADQQELAGAASSLATDLVTGMRPLRGIGAEEAAAARYRQVSRRSLDAMVRAARTQGVFQAASTAASTLLAGGIAVLAGWFALTGRITVGEFITVIGLATFLMEPFGLLAIVPSWVAEAKASADRIAQIENAPHILPEPDATALPAVRGLGLRLAGLGCGPLSGIDLHVRPGEFVGLVAERPADAETLVRLLAVPADFAGEILVGDYLAHEVSLRDLDRDAARRLLLVEPHHADLFTGTLGTNLGLPSPGAAAVDGARPADSPVDDPEVVDGAGEVAAALRAANADEVVALHPAGLDHEVTERGASLSGGQRQRLALARALLARPPILVLHDPTTAVDAVTEHAIAGGVKAMRAGLTTLVVTSSPALLAAADRVVVLDHGMIGAQP